MNEYACMRACKHRCHFRVAKTTRASSFFFFYLCEIRSNKLSNVLMRDCETVLWFCASVQCILYVLYVRRPNIDERITATENFERIMQHIVSVYLRCAMCANTHYDFFFEIEKKKDGREQRWPSGRIIYASHTLMSVDLHILKQYNVK